MVRDAYANYVVQTAIDVVPEGTERRMLVNELKANEAHLVSSLHFDYILLFFIDFPLMLWLIFIIQRNYTFAKHIVAKLGTK